MKYIFMGLLLCAGCTAKKDEPAIKLCKEHMADKVWSHEEQATFLMMLLKGQLNGEEIAKYEQCMLDKGLQVDR